MRRGIFGVKAILLFLLGLCYAQGGYKWAIVRVDSRQELSSLIGSGMIVDRYDFIRKEAYIYVNEMDKDWLKKAGYVFDIVQPESPIGRRLYPGSLDGYHTYDQVRTTLRGYESTYGSICKFDSIGPTALGRWIWILKISDNVVANEGEPQFRFMSTIHGDEPVGMEMCLYFAEHILSNYATDTLIQRLVNNCEIYIIPLLNPDGYVARQRTNANGVDLNRNYPVPDGSIGDDGTYVLQPETQAIVDFTLPKNFILSANFHGGATVVNYPWDYTPVRAPDDSLLKVIALTYSSLNSLMWNSTEFPQGITNGYDWYQVRGSLQDWLYDRAELDFTIELYDTKWPDASLLPSLWNYNRDAMLAFLNWASKGVYGFVRDSLTNAPIKATITMNISGKPVISDSVTGYYHRIIYPGSYAFTYSAPGYYSRILPVDVPSGGSVRVDLKLYPVGSCVVSGYVDIVGAPADSGAIVICRNDSLTFTDTTNEYGYFEFSSVYALGEWQIIVSKSGYADTALIVDLTGRSSYSLNFALYPYAYLYVSDFEANNGGLNVVGSSSDWEWGTPTVGPPSAHSGMKLWATKLNSNYSNNSNSILQLPPIVLPDWSNPKLKFWHWYSFEYSSSTGRYYDGGNVKISVDGGAYNVITPIGGYNCTIYSSNPYLGGERAFGGSSNGWREVIFDLLSYVGHTITIRIHFGSDAYTRYPGWYIDDVMVVSPDYSLAISEPFYEKPLSLSISSIYPNPFNSSFKIKLNGIKGEKRIEIFLYDVLGREVMRSEFAPTELISIDFSSRRSINLSSGVYLLRIKQGESETTAKVIYLR